MEIFNKLAPYILIILTVLVIYAFYIRPQRNTDKRFSQGYSSLKPGDEIITIGGIFAIVAEKHEDYLIVQVIPSHALMKIKPQAVAVFPAELVARKAG